MLKCGKLNGARALGREDDLGSVEAGKLADIIIVNKRRPHMIPEVRLVSNLVHYGQASDVESVIVGGEFVLEDGTVLTLDEDAVMRNAQEAPVGAWQRMHEQFPDSPDLSPPAW